jgi:hypothetical protein
MTDFHDLVGEDLNPEEERRLRRVHELLVQAGPPPELPPALREPVARRRWQLPSFRLRLAPALALVAASVAIAFGVGYLVGDRGGGFSTEHVVAMRPTAAGPPTAVASIKVGAQDEAGNWPLVLYVKHLPEQPVKAYYELWLTRNGKTVATCGTFRVHGDETTVRLNAPYKLKAFDGWVVTTDKRDRVLLTTA